MTEPPKDEHKPVLHHKYSMDATLKRSIPVVEAESEVRSRPVAKCNAGPVFWSKIAEESLW